MKKIIIRFIIDGLDQKLKDLIKKEIEKITKKLDLESTIAWKYEANYYKMPNHKDCTLEVIFQKNIKITELIPFFNCKWVYENESILDKNNNSIEEEEAIWSKLCNPEQVFIDPKVQWVHRYNWE